MKKTDRAKRERKRLPIKAGREFVKAHGLRYVVIFARGQTVSHIVTYGNTIEESEAAAQLGNQMKRGLSWPDSTQAMPPRVQRNQCKLARKIADSLFVNGAGEEAKRLVLELKPGADGGGLCRQAVVDRVEEIIRKG